MSWWIGIRSVAWRRREQVLHAEEVRVEDGSEEELVDSDLYRGERGQRMPKQSQSYKTSSGHSGYGDGGIYLGSQAQHLTPIIKTIRQPQKPPIPGDSSKTPDQQRAARTVPIALFDPRLHPADFIVLILTLTRFHYRNIPFVFLPNALRNQVPDKVYHQRTCELREIRSSALDTAICAERLVDWFEPEPKGPWDGFRGCGGDLGRWKGGDGGDG